MNERIKQLAEEAGGGPSKWYTNPEVLEYFSQLVIREFAYDCMNVTSTPDHINFVAKQWGVEL